MFFVISFLKFLIVKKCEVKMLMKNSNVIVRFVYVFGRRGVSYERYSSIIVVLEI